MYSVHRYANYIHTSMMCIYIYMCVCVYTVYIYMCVYIYILYIYIICIYIYLCVRVCVCDNCLTCRKVAVKISAQLFVTACGIIWIRKLELALGHHRVGRAFPSRTGGDNRSRSGRCRSHWSNRIRNSWRGLAGNGWRGTHWTKYRSPRHANNSRASKDPLVQTYCHM